MRLTENSFGVSCKFRSTYWRLRGDFARVNLGSRVVLLTAAQLVATYRVRPRASNLGNILARAAAKVTGDIVRHLFSRATKRLLRVNQLAGVAGLRAV